MAGSDSAAFLPGSSAEGQSPSFTVIGAEEATSVAQMVLDQNPRALVAGMNRSGLQIPIPESFDTLGATEISGSIFGMIGSSDASAVVETFERARHRGAARCRVHLTVENNRPADYHVYNLDATHGFLLWVILPLDIVEDDDQGSVASSDHFFKPRFCTVVKDEVAEMMEVDEAFSAMFGFQPGEVLHSRSLNLIHPDDHQIAVEAWLHMVANPQQPRPVKLRHKHADGHFVWVEVVNHNQLSEAGQVRADIADITDQMAAQEALAERERLLQALVPLVWVGVCGVGVRTPPVT